MKILIVSDSHGYSGNLRRAVEKESPVDALLHLGDSQSNEEEMSRLAGCPAYMVAGNCDYFTRLPLTRFVEFGKNRIMLTHGHQYFVTVDTRDLLEAAGNNRCNIVVYGHTHRPVMDGSNGEILVLNPGSISFPRQEGRLPSYMVMEIDEAGEAHVRLEYV